MPRPYWLPPDENTYPEPVKTQRGFRHRYSVTLPYPVAPWQLELACWANRYPTGFGSYYHLRRAIEILLPESAWHEWRETRYRSLCDDEDSYQLGGIRITNHSWVGVASAAKTYDAALYAYLFWLAAPGRSYAILTSTSKNKIKQRSWSAIQEFYIATRNILEASGVPPNSGPHMLNSTMELQALKGDSKHAVFAQAIEPGEVAKAVTNLRGVHADRICLVIDEADGTPEAIYATIPNMLKGCAEFVLINSANGPHTHLDPFSTVCTPVGGWSSISIEHERWRTRPVSQFQLPGGICHHFDGTKSPNVRAGRTLFPFLYTYENWARVANDPDAQRTASFWSQDRGFWPPDGFINTVLTEELIERGDARRTVTEFDGAPTPIGAIDPGFGGDKCVLRLGFFGRTRGASLNGSARGGSSTPVTSTTRLAAQLVTRIEIPILVDLVRDDKKVPAEYQISERVIEECTRFGVTPEHFGVEATGTGRGVAAVLTQEWGEVLAVESGGSPSELPASEEDERPANHVYDRRITELWFSVQAFVRGGHLGGLSPDDVTQFCARTYTFVSKKYSLEKKEDFKARFGRSPDDADSVAVFVNVAREHGLHTRGPRADRHAQQWNSVQATQTELYHEEGLYQPESSADAALQSTGPSWDPA